MIKVNKDFAQVPKSLLSSKNKKAFENNIQASRYISKDSCYKGADVRKKLEAIYHRKCAFCEKDLLDTTRAVEHFRPKRKSSNSVSKCKADFSYYWLALSWDNLLLACTQCNTSKGNCFDIQNARANYQQETFEEIHAKSTAYQESEKPMLINPEQEDPKGLFYFDINAQIHPVNNHARMRYAIDICNLNRIELVESRLMILNDFKNCLNRNFELFTRRKDLNYFKNTIQDFVEKTKEQNAYFAWRSFILAHFDEFILNSPNSQFNTVVKLAFLKYKN
jgi:uncharacterized protein (TIGR02646 family)